MSIFFSKTNTNAKANKGFTLIELLVVMAIILILLSVGVVAFSQAEKGARDGKRKNDMETVRQAMTLYRSDTGAYATGASYSAVAQALVLAGYLSSPFPLDPLSQALNQSFLAQMLDISVQAAVTYPYTYNGDSTRFCICSRMEVDGKGNSSAGANGTCSGINSGAPFNYYCVKQL